MSEVIVIFVGICTHIQNITLTPPADALSPSDTQPGDYSCAVLVNGSQGSEGIPPHNALLYIPSQFVETPASDIMLAGLETLDPDAIMWRLKGARMYFTNAVPGLSHSQSYRNLPSLTVHSGQPSLELDPRVVSKGRAAAVVEIYAGNIDAYRHEAQDAVHATMRIHTASDDRELVVTRYWDGLQTRLRLKDGLVNDVPTPPHVFVMNTGVDVDKEIDFLLHYDVTTWNPPPGHRPDLSDLRGIRQVSSDDPVVTLLGDIPSGLSIGCSNSNYP